MIIRKSSSEIETMANAGRIVADTIALIGENLRPGVTTAELDELADEYIRSQGGTSSFLGYRGYPASICTSPNDVVVHGIPDGTTLSEGDILSVDVGVILDGFVADSAYTFAGRGDLARGRAAARGLPGRPRGGHRAVPAGQPPLGRLACRCRQATEEAGFSVVRSLVGHGIGRSMHEDPQIPNYGPPGRGPGARSRA